MKRKEFLKLIPSAFVGLAVGSVAVKQVKPNYELLGFSNVPYVPDIDVQIVKVDRRYGRTITIPCVSKNTDGGLTLSHKLFRRIDNSRYSEEQVMGEGIRVVADWGES